MRMRTVIVCWCGLSGLIFLRVACSVSRSILAVAGQSTVIILVWFQASGHSTTQINYTLLNCIAWKKTFLMCRRNVRYLHKPNTIVFSNLFSPINGAIGASHLTGAKRLNSKTLFVWEYLTYLGQGTICFDSYLFASSFLVGHFGLVKFHVLFRTPFGTSYIRCVF